MEPSNMVEWAVYIGIAFLVFSVITGFDDVISKFASGSPTKKDLLAKIDELEKRVSALESASKH